MSDLRASIKIEMDFCGVKEKADMNINYIPDDFSGIDPRIAEFFEDVYKKGINKYNIEVQKYFKKQREEELEQKEKEELQRLKNKYEESR